MRDDVVQLAADPVALLRPRPLGQPGLGLTQLGDQIDLLADQQAGQDGEGGARHPRPPARIPVEPRPFHREKDQHGGQEDHGLAARPDQRQPHADQAHREPADVARQVVAQDGDPGGGYRGVGQQRPPLVDEQGAGAQGGRGRDARGRRAGVHRQQPDHDQRGEHG